MEDLERVLKGVERDAKRKGGPLKRRFIITEGIFENTGVLVNLPRIVSLWTNVSRQELTSAATFSVILRSS